MRNILDRSFIRGILLSLFLGITSICFALMNDYLPMKEKDLKKTFPLHCRREIPVGPGIASLAVGLTGALIAAPDEGDVTISGRDRHGNLWSVKLANREYSVWIADLDKNSIPDAVLLFNTMGCGLAPSQHFISVMFDPEGRPFFFEVDGYYDESPMAISGLLDLNQDGQAELIYMNWSDGYWITSFYKAEKARWERVEGSLGKYVFPMFTRFTNRPNRKPTTPAKDRHPFGSDFSQEKPKVSGKLLSYKWANVAQSENIELHLKTTDGKTFACSPDSWNSTFSVVIDGASGRRIVSLSASEAEVKSLLDEIIAAGLPIVCYGQRRGDSFNPEMLWANDNSD